MSKDRPQEDHGVSQYTNDVLARGISRRSFLSRAAAGVGMLGLASGAAEAANVVVAKGR